MVHYAAVVRYALCCQSTALVVSAVAQTLAGGANSQPASMLHLAHFSYTGIPLLWPVCTEYTLGPLFGGATSPPTNLWAIRREWLRIARSDTNPSHPIYARWMLL